MPLFIVLFPQSTAAVAHLFVTRLLRMDPPPGPPLGDEVTLAGLVRDRAPAPAAPAPAPTGITAATPVQLEDTILQTCDSVC